MKTKKAVLAIIAVLMVFTLTGCIGKFIPVAVTIDGQDVSSGMYLLMQLNAYNEAMGLVEEEDIKTVDTFFAAKIEDKKVIDWIADKTQENCTDYIAVLHVAKEKGVVLSEEDIETIDASLATWDSIKGTYEANGIGEETVRAYYEYATLANNLFLKLYSEDGELSPTRDELSTLYAEKYSRVRFMVVNLADAASETGEFAETADDARIAVKALVEKLNDGELTLNEAAYKELAALNAIANPLAEGKEPETSDVELDDDGEEIMSANLYAQFLSNEPDENGLYVEEFLTRLKGEANGTFGYYESELAKAMIVYEKLPIFETDKEYEDTRENMIQELMQDGFKEHLRKTSDKYTVEWTFGARWFYSPKKVVTGQGQGTQ